MLIKVGRFFLIIVKTTINLSVEELKRLIEENKKDF